MDSTYKLVYGQHPVQVAGFSDCNSKFHPTLMAISADETTWTYDKIIASLNFREPKVILADGAPQITKAVRENTSAARATCWAHVIRAIDRQLLKIKEEIVKEQLRNDIMVLQLSPNQIVFDNGKNLSQFCNFNFL